MKRKSLICTSAIHSAKADRVRDRGGDGWWGVSIVASTCLMLSASVQGLSEHSRPLRSHSLTAFLSNLISFSQYHLAWSDNHNSFLGEASAAPAERGGKC